VKFSKAQIQAKFHKISVIRFEEQQLTFFQLLFKFMDLKQRLKKCFVHLKLAPIFGRHLIASGMGKSMGKYNLKILRQIAT